MTMNHDAVMEAFRQLTEQACGGRPVVIGALPPNGGVSLLAAGGTVERYMDGSVFVKQQITINTKDTQKREALRLLTAAAGVLHAPPPEDVPFQVTGIGLRRAPAQVGLDAAGNALYSATYEVRAFFGRDNGEEAEQ